MSRKPKQFEEEDKFDSNFDRTVAIDYELLKKEISEHGAVTWTIPDHHITLVLDITPCQCGEETCTEDVIQIRQESGFTSLSTTLRKGPLLESNSLQGFFNDFLHNPSSYYSSSGEKQLIEQQIHQHLGFKPLDVYFRKIKLDNLKTILSPECKQDFWRAHTLQSIFQSLLLQRIEMEKFDGEEIEKTFKGRFKTDKDFREYFNHIYDLGFLTGRLISEHFIRYEIEPLAKKGMAAEAAQEKRNKASGESASEKKHTRISAMLKIMETLSADNPAIARVGAHALGRIAIEDAANEDPNLWSQGKAQLDQYLDEMRADIRYQEKFKRIFPNTA